MAELADAQRSGRCPALRGGGSIPLFGTDDADVAEFGIRVRLRCVSRKGWRFESSRPHICLDGLGLSVNIIICRVYPERSEGHLAQLVQSVAFTLRRSGVRIPQCPQA